MQDEKIIALYWSRNEIAIDHTRAKYGRYCNSIAQNILNDSHEAEECENDTYLQVWNSIPPHRPNSLSAFLGKITRRISLDRLRRRTAIKRGSGAATLSLEELRQCIPDGKTIDEHLQAQELANQIDCFLRTLPVTERSIFVCRYWYCDSIHQIAKRFGCGESRVKTALHRTRQKLKTHLEKEGIYI